MADIGIGRLAELTGVKIPTIRFYEQNGLIPLPIRTMGGQRRYDDRAVRRLVFIRHAREFGFDANEIRQLLELADRPTLPCDTAMKVARHHREEVEAKIARLRLICSELKRMIKSCQGGPAAECRILESLAEDRPIRRKKIGKRGSA
jgi:DNA-binding transcriptional MerR regulator